MSTGRCTEWRGEHAAVVDNHVNYIDLLALYEDLVYSPETLAAIIKEWKEWADAKNEGRLHIIPKGDEKPAHMVFLVKGHAIMGRRARDAAGNIYIDEPAHFDFDDEGPAVAVGTINTATMEIQVDPETPSAYGDWEQTAYLTKVLELLAPRRKGDIPDLEGIIKKQARSYGTPECPFFSECEQPECANCIVDRWVEETKEETR